MAISSRPSEGRNTLPPTHLEVLRQEMGEGFSIERIQAMLKDKKERKQIIEQLKENHPERSEKELIEQVEVAAENAEKTLKSKEKFSEKSSTWLGRRWEWVKRNKWVILAIGGAVVGYLTWSNWDLIKSWMARLTGVEAAAAQGTATQAGALPLVRPVEGLQTAPGPALPQGPLNIQPPTSGPNIIPNTGELSREIDSMR